MKVVGREPVVAVRNSAATWAPASLSNLGPGFDVLGLAIDAWGDRIEAILTDRPGITVSYSSDSAWTGSLDPQQNTAGVAARSTLSSIGYTGGIELVIHKSIPPGSGVGSSASSAVAAAWAVNLLFGSPLSKSQIVESTLAGESVASGSAHGDNVIPSLFGGMAIVSSSNPSYYRRVRLDESLYLSVVLPSVQILTRAAREMLPKQVGFYQAIQHSSELAMLIDAFKDGDWVSVGRHIMEDHVVEPVRSQLLSCYYEIKEAALTAGSYGCALSGSGPAMFAVSEDPNIAEGVLKAMKEACESTGVEATGVVTTPNNDGVREWDIQNIA